MKFRVIGLARALLFLWKRETYLLERRERPHVCSRLAYCLD
jgi:hypothetical protein